MKIIRYRINGRAAALEADRLYRRVMRRLWRAHRLDGAQPFQHIDRRVKQQGSLILQVQNQSSMVPAPE